MIAKMPRDVSLQESVHRGLDLRVSAFKDGAQLFAAADDFEGEFLERLVETDAFDHAVVPDEADLIAGVVEFFEEGHEVVDEDDNVFDGWDGGYDLGEDGVFVVLPGWEEASRHAVAETVQAAEEEGEIVGAWESVEVVLLDPATLEDYGIVSGQLCVFQSPVVRVSGPNTMKTKGDLTIEGGANDVESAKAPVVFHDVE